MKPQRAFLLGLGVGSGLVAATLGLAVADTYMLRKGLGAVGLGQAVAAGACAFGRVVGSPCQAAIDSYVAPNSCVDGEAAPTSGCFAAAGKWVYATQAPGGGSGFALSPAGNVTLNFTGGPPEETQTFTLQNRGSTLSGPIAVNLSSTVGYALTTDNCTGQRLQAFPGPGDECTVIVTSSPSVSGAIPATTLTMTDGTSAAQATISGNSTLVACGASSCIYRTATTHTGNLGGLAGGDAICNADPGKPAGSGTAYAILATGTGRSWPSGREFNLRLPVRRAADDVVVATTSTQFWCVQQGCAAWAQPISTASGSEWWSGHAWQYSNGSWWSTSDGDTCSDWTTASVSFEGNWGYTHVTDKPSVFQSGSGGSRTCNLSKYLVCIIP